MKEVEAYKLFEGLEGVIRMEGWEVKEEKGDGGKTVYVLLEYLRRGNLQDAINANLVERGRFPERRLMGLFLGVCRALKGMHQFGSGNGGRKGKGKGKRAVRGGAEDEPHTAANSGRRRRNSTEGDNDEEDEPLMESSGLAAQEGGQIIQGYAHRDIKPGNIMISDDGLTPILMDFGSLAPSPLSITSRAMALQIQDQAAEHSTMPYRAPELFDVKTDTVVDTKVDIWSLGCTLYACLVGKSPFEARSEETGGSLSLCVLGGDWRFPDENVPGAGQANKRGKQRVVSGEEEADAKKAMRAEVGISEGVKEVVRRCLVVEPSERPGIEELIGIVEECIEGLSPEDDDGEVLREEE